MEKFWASLLVIPIFTWYSFHAVLDRDFRIRQQAVENIVYQYTQIAAKKGALYDSVYNEMEDRLSRFGNFYISLTAERFTGTGDTPELMEGDEIIGRDLRSEGFDIINIYAESTNRHPLGRLYDITPFGTKSGAEADIRYFGRASVYIQ
ncbi:MAG: hypothetical protein VB106_02950 [Clostridiaceae bacterium]|jgi:hypothetical protein|nr:hypothetical protein [Clostridiaceae bacterium]